MSGARHARVAERVGAGFWAGIVSRDEKFPARNEDGGSGRVPDALPAATGPIEATGRRRHDARLLVSSRFDGTDTDTVFAALPGFLDPGDVLVINTSATLPAAVPTRDGLLLHLSSELPGGLRLVELRQPDGAGSSPLSAGRPGTLDLAAGGRADLLAPYPVDGTGRRTRLWVAHLDLPGGLLPYLAEHGRPIRYGTPERPWPLDAYQTVFATEPGSAEMPSAARGFTAELVTALVARGVVFAPIVLHCGVSSPEAGEPPQPERYRVPATTAALVNAARGADNRIVAVGTTATRALETTAGEDGTVHPGRGWTELVVTPERGVRAIDGLLTGWHEPEASHLDLIEAVARRATLERAYAKAGALGYHGHEFGDFHLIVP
ncbi:MAG: S-adenosylmethionine:tRNA ribosyltransferase-isomerase [Acidimicrobiia bacterium]